MLAELHLDIADKGAHTVKNKNSTRTKDAARHLQVQQPALPKEGDRCTSLPETEK